MKKIQKIISVLSAGILIMGQLAPVVRAFEAPSAPTPPPEPTTAPSAPTPPPEPNEQPEAPTVNEAAPTPPEAPEAPTLNNNDTTSTDTNDQTTNEVEEQQEETPQQEQTQESDSSGSVGDTTINTGDASTTVSLTTETNTNLSEEGSGSGDGGSAAITNSGNGADSTNTGSLSLSNENNTIQNNSAFVASGMGLSATTGTNDASKNVGNSTIDTGDANVSGTLVTAVNTNVAGMMVSEFNVVDDHVGDLVLDFAANCISGCATGDTTVANTGNGADSTNTTNLDFSNADTTFQTNDATVLNSMVLDANSGDNEANKNTGGDSTITTGDANITANMITFANNNIAGDVMYGVVNIYGNLIGDIILPENQLTNCCLGSATLANSGNGSDSTNTITADTTNTNEMYQTNVAVIDNILDLDVTTGDNSTSKNTGGNNSIETGDASLFANVLNVANTNLDGGTWWLVLVNEAGQWLGKIMGADDGANYAGSQGTEFAINDAGEITVTNSGNGGGSTNTTNLTQANAGTTVQTNTAHVVNTATINANTGNNSTSSNTGGNNSITTGDANVIANIVNFVNNNMVGGGKLLVTVVNVFGSWLGDFVAPGTSKETQELAANANDPVTEQGGTGGAQVHQQGSQSSSSNSNSDSLGSPSSSTQPTVQPQPAYAGENSFGVLGSGQTSSALVLSETAGSSQNGISETQGRKIIQINLAWLILLIPSAILAIVLRRIRRKTPATI